jgi:probable F420-dependent oxidoreductase
VEIGIVFPTTEMENDPALVRRYATRAEELGFEHLLTYEHVLGTDPERPDWEGPFDAEDPFHEPFTLFSHLASVTDELNFVTGILILPQRQTALVAKQAAEVDRLSGGRLRLGVGLGWNQPEYRALGESFSDRGRRIEEQITVMNKLWSEDIVDFDGTFHTIDRMGLKPKPDGGTIPIWMGGSADPVLDRIARMAEGWLPQFQPDPDAHDRLDNLHDACRRHDRDPDTVGIHGRLKVESDLGKLNEGVNQWRDLGADYLSINPMYRGWSGREHLDVLERIDQRLER